MTDNTKSQNYEPMTPEEVSRLQQILEDHNDSPARYIAIPSLFVIILGIGALITPFAMDMLFAAILCWPTAAGAFWFAWLGFKIDSKYMQTKSNLKADLKNSTKESYHTVIQKKRETRGRYGNMHYITIMDQEYPVDVTTFTRFDASDRVTVSVSEKAREVVGIKKIEH